LFIASQEESWEEWVEMVVTELGGGQQEVRGRRMTAWYELCRRPTGGDGSSGTRSVFFKYLVSFLDDYSEYLMPG
jgi:hypothetical protein